MRSRLISAVVFLYIAGSLSTEHRKSTNVAVLKPSYQITLWDRTADKGNDGNRNDDMACYSCFETPLIYEPWWYVDLQAVYSITRVDIYNRLDCCGKKARNIEIATAITIGNWSQAAYHNGTIGNFTSVSVNYVQARYVRLTVKHMKMKFHLCEIEVYGYNQDMETKCKEVNWQYQQTSTETHAGMLCQRWDSQSPHRHNFTNASDFPDETIADAGNFCRNPNNDLYAWCYTASEIVEWDYCDILKCTEEAETKCEEENWQYQQTLTETRKGIPCQRWDSQSPHRHYFTNASDFPDETIADAGNFCRNPNNDLYAWCYTTNKNIELDFCDILECKEDMETQCEVVNWQYQQTSTVTRRGIPCQRWDSQSPHRHNFTDASYFHDVTIAEAGNYCRNPDNDLYAWCYTTNKNTGWEYCDIMKCTKDMETQCREKIWQYQQTLTETRRGIPCQRWDSQSPHRHNFTNASDFPDETIADAGNFCRNPDTDLYAWCYTTNKSIEWDECEVPTCIEEFKNPCAEKKRQYQQTLTVTREGIPCQRWDSQSPHEHHFTNASDFPDETIADAGNFCRNPDNYPYAWCFTTDKNIRLDFCDILYCTDAQLPNLALGKPSYMSASNLTPDKGNDGNRNSFFKTTTEYEPWWYVDLEAIYIITRVDIYNRLDYGMFKARSIEIATAITKGNWSRVAYYEGEVSESKSISVNNAQARYVKLTMKNITDTFHLGEIEVYGYKILQCPKDTDSYGIDWDSGIPGKYMQHPCPEGYKSGWVKRLCDVSGKFHDPVYNCTRPEIEDIYRKLFDEKHINGATYILDDLVDATALDNATNQTLMIGDIEAVSHILTKITEMVEVNTVDINKTTNSFVEVANNILREETAMTWQGLMNETGSGADAVIDTLDHFLEKVATAKGEYTTSFALSNLMVKLDLSGVCEKKIHFPDRQHDTLPAWAEDTADSIDVPCSDDQDRRPYSVVMYRDVSDILPARTSESGISSNIKLNAPVLSFTFFPRITGKLDSPVEITFELFDTTWENPRCTYWKKNNNSKNGFWSDEGCRLSEYNKKKNTVVCRCNHLTNFAVLMAPTSMRLQRHVAILGTLSMAGCITSMICLCLTLLMYAIFWKDVRTATTVININLVLALFMAYLVFLTGIEQTKNKVICTAIAILLHLVFLVVFCIMLTEGICLAYSVYKPFSSRRPAVPLLIASYVLPCIIVGISTSVVQLEGYGSKEFCWLSTNSGLIWTFATPVLTVVSINFVIIGLVIRKLCGTVAMTRKTDSERAKAGIRSVLVLMPITGVTWVFGIFSINEDTVIFQYLFAIFNSLQGVLIFVFHCVMNKQIQKAFYRSLGVSKSGSSQTPETKTRSTEPKASQSADI